MKDSDGWPELSDYRMHLRCSGYCVAMTMSAAVTREIMNAVSGQVGRSLCKLGAANNIDRLFPFMRKIDMCRLEKRLGVDRYGDQSGHFHG